MINDIFIDSNITDIGADILKALTLNGVMYVSLKRNIKVGGRSWEMSAAMALIGRNGVYSGEVESFTPPLSFTFGKVPGINIKEKLADNLITSIDLPFV